MTMVEARRGERVRSFLRARIVFNNKNSSIDCTIKNISPTGAKLEVANTFSLPAEFDLQIPAKNRTVRAKMMWRDAEALGVEFQDQNTNASAAEQTIETLERENRKLKTKLALLTKRLQDLGQDVSD